MLKKRGIVIFAAWISKKEYNSQKRACSDPYFRATRTTMIPCMVAMPCS